MEQSSLLLSVIKGKPLYAYFFPQSDVILISSSSVCNCTVFNATTVPSAQRLILIREYPFSVVPPGEEAGPHVHRNRNRSTGFRPIDDEKDKPEVVSYPGMEKKLTSSHPDTIKSSRILRKRWLRALPLSSRFDRDGRLQEAVI